MDVSLPALDYFLNPKSMSNNGLHGYYYGFRAIILHTFGLDYLGIVLNYCQYGVLYLGSYYNTGPYIDFPHFGNSNLGKLPLRFLWDVVATYYTPTAPVIVMPSWTYIGYIILK